MFGVLSAVGMWFRMRSWLFPPAWGLEAVFLGPLFRKLAVSSGLFFKVRLEFGVPFRSGQVFKFNGPVQVFG